MTTKLLEILERNGYSDTELVENQAFREFCEWLTTVDLLSQKLVQYGACNSRSAKRMARALYNYCEGLPKTDAPPDDELHFKSWWTSIFALNTNKELVGEVHGFGNRGAEYLDNVLLRMWINFATQKALGQG